MTENDLKKLFEKYGEILSVFIPPNQAGDEQYGYVNFKTHQ